jgi:lysophospholipase L1-like esterase
VLSLLLWGAFAHATEWSAVVSFGASQLDNESLYAGHPLGAALYGDDPVEVLASLADPPGVVWEYAESGAVSADIDGQIASYFRDLAAGAPEATVLVLVMGGNDLLDQAEVLAEVAPGESAGVDRAIDGLASRIADRALRLQRALPEARVLVFNLPDLGETPKLARWMSPAQRDRFVQHIDRLNRRLEVALAPAPRVLLADVRGALGELVEAEVLFGGAPLCASPDRGRLDCLFADLLHPTAATNAWLGNALAEQVEAAWGDELGRVSEARLAELAGR